MKKSSSSKPKRKAQGHSDLTQIAARIAFVKFCWPSPLTPLALGGLAAESLKYISYSVAMSCMNAWWRRFSSSQATPLTDSVGLHAGVVPNRLAQPELRLSDQVPSNLTNYRSNSEGPC
jgi:hypothetical protein